MHLGSLHRHAAAYPDAASDLADLRPGDVFIGNDAYDGGGTHLPDFVLLEPIFVDASWSPGR